MNIALVNSCPYLGGAEFWFLRAALYLKARGHRVELFCRPGGLADRAENLGIPVTRLLMLFDLDLVSFLRFFFAFRRSRPQVVLLNDQRECRLAGPAGAWTGVPVRVQRKGWPYMKNSWRDRLVYTRFVNHILCVSSHVREELLSIPGLDPERVRLFPNAVDWQRFAQARPRDLRQDLGIAKDSKLVGTVGRLVSHKGHDIFIRMAGKLLDAGLNADFIIIGEGRGEAELRGLIQTLDLQDRVRLLGFREDLPEILKSLDLFVFPTLGEGMPNALLEAMAAGLPVVASDIPGSRELVKSEGSGGHEVRGILTPAGDVSALVQAVGRLLSEPELAEGLGRNAAEWVRENHDQEEMFDRLEQYLKDMVEMESSVRKDS
jgi:glycosyltransferase involved in cell wall biosynthesis